MDRRVRETNIEAYRKIKEEGLLSFRRWEVYDILFRHGPLTANEVFVKLQEESRGPRNAASNSAARFSELRDCGVISELGTRICSITGMEVILWDVTSNLPEKEKKEIRQTLKQKINELENKIRSLQEENAALRAKYEPTLNQSIGQLNLFNQSVTKAFSHNPVRS